MTDHFYDLLGAVDLEQLNWKAHSNILQGFAAIIDLVGLPFLQVRERIFPLIAYVENVLRHAERTEEHAAQLCKSSWAVFEPLLGFAQSSEAFADIFASCRPIFGMVLKRVASPAANTLGGFRALLLYVYFYDTGFVAETVRVICEAFSERFRLTVHEAFSDLFNGLEPPVTPDLIRCFEKRVYAF
ncbi:MAG: hypothetical protein LBB61_01795, partial [Treponema sp.]|nr:hypothetical protein [Treponema sp.]